MKFFSLSAGRLMRAAFCGLLAATVLPTAASADDIIGGVSVTTPSTPLTASVTVSTASTPVTAPVTVSTPSVSVPSVTASAATAPSVRASATSSTPIASVRITATPQINRSTSKASARAKRAARRKPTQKPSRRKSKPTRFLLSTTTTTSPFYAVIQNPCFITDTVEITGQQSISTQLQPDGSLRLYTAIGGSAISLTTGAKYAFSQETHGAFEFPALSPIRFYDYKKLYRQGEEPGISGIVEPYSEPPTGSGDDFFVRFYDEIPGATGGGPNMNSLMTTVDGMCR